MSENATTAVARPTLPPAALAAIEERKLRNAVIQQIRGATWSKDLSPDGIRAVAQWCRDNDVDAATEVDVLGGNLYIKARHYERKLSYLVGAGQIEYARGEWIHADARLAALVASGDEWAIEEETKRKRARIRYRVSEESDAAMAYFIKHRQMDEPVVGVKEHIPGRKRTIKKKDGGSFQVDADPVGDQAPSETIETRALRRAMLKLKESMPQLQIATVSDESGKSLQTVIDETRAAHAELVASVQPSGKALAAPRDGIYGLDDLAEQDDEPVAEEIQEPAKAPKGEA